MGMQCATDLVCIDRSACLDIAALAVRHKDIDEVQTRSAGQAPRCRGSVIVQDRAIGRPPTVMQLIARLSGDRSHRDMDYWTGQALFSWIRADRSHPTPRLSARAFALPVVRRYPTLCCPPCNHANARNAGKQAPRDFPE